MQLILPEVPKIIFTLLITCVMIISLTYFSYEKKTAILKWLCLVLLVYIIVPFLVNEAWADIFFALFIPEIQWNAEYLYILVAINGTTISPYLFFWQSSMSLEHKNLQNKKYPKKNKKTSCKWIFLLE